MEDGVGYDITVPLNYLDLTRATEQVAIELSHVLGRGILTRTEFEKCNLSSMVVPEPTALAVSTIENRAIKSVLGRLDREMFCSGTIQYFHAQGEKNRERLKDYLEKPLGHKLARQLGGDWSFDLAISPCDGLFNLLHGRPGPAFSVIAGGPSGVFDVSLKERTDQEFLVLTIKSEPENAGKLLPPKLRTDSTDKSTKSLLETLADIKLIDRLITGTQYKSNPEHLTIATHTSDPKQNSAIIPTLSRYARVHDLTGSPFGAGISTFFPKTGIDVAVLLVTSVHVILIAAAACASGNDFYAFPIAKGDSNDIPQVEPSTPVYRKQDLIKGDDVFVVMTSISDNLILDGIRYTRNGLVKTHSLCIRSKTYSQRSIEQQHNLQRKRFHHIDSSEPLSYPEVLKKYFSQM